MRSQISSRQIPFDPTPEIFATGVDGRFSYLLADQGEPWLDTSGFDEARIVLSLWHPSAQRSIDLDR